MPRNPNDAPSQVGGQSSSTSDNQAQQQQTVTQPTDINTTADNAVKPATGTEVAASSMGQLKLKLDEFHLTDEHNKAIVDSCLQND